MKVIGSRLKMNKIRLSKSSISQAEKEAVLGVLDKEFLGMGEEVDLFEKKIKQYLQTEMDVACVNTGTSALHLSLSMLGVKDGDEVLVPSLTYVASFQAISATGATPVSCEIDPTTLFIDVKDAREKITQNTKAIMPVHYASSSKGMDEVYKLAKEFGLRVVEDAAQAFGSKRDGVLVGGDGDVICFSFDGIKNITSGEGGAILSFDNNFMQKVKDSRLLGVERDTEKRYQKQRSWDFDVKSQGFRYHMSNIMAAIGTIQIDRIQSFKSKRQNIVKRYVKELSILKETKVLTLNFDEIMPHIFVIKVKKRDELRNFLISNDVECGIHYKPNHLLCKYTTPTELPITEGVYKEILTLPCHYDLTEVEQGIVIEKIYNFYQ
jgi:dTDP-4-amino-4,6-dideoxygalactose transaminase